MGVVVAILDIVGSRQHADQVQLLTGVGHTIATWASERTGVEAGPTVGDEFQVVWSDPALSRALADVAELRLRLSVPRSDGASPVRVRVGLGSGEIVQAGPGGASAPSQSGTAWWNARAALDRLDEARNGWPTQQWWIVGDAVDAVTRSLLVCMDTLEAGFDDKDRRCALGLVAGRSAKELAEDLGVTESTMSSRLHGHGVYGWWRTWQLLGARG